jgi:threonine/homoserine/homoserine lactone efflux protein
MIEVLIAGVFLGLSAGLAPGPLVTLMITQSLQYGSREGIKVAVAPLITDAPIIAFSLLALIRLGSTRNLMAAVTLAGALFLTFLAIGTIRTDHIETNEAEATPPRSISKGAAVNLLNPHPYLFWLTVGCPLLVRAWRASHIEAFTFLASFYVCMVGSKIVVVVAAGRGRRLLTDKLYPWVMRVLGAVLLVFALLFARDGLRIIMSQ